MASVAVASTFGRCTIRMSLITVKRRNAETDIGDIALERRAAQTHKKGPTTDTEQELPENSTLLEAVTIRMTVAEMPNT